MQSQKPAIVSFSLLLLLGAQAPNPKQDVNKDAALQEQLRKEIEPLVRDLLKDIDQRLAGVEAKIQAQSTSQGTAQQGSAKSAIQFQLSSGIPKKSFFEEYMAIIIPSVVSIVVVFLGFITQVKLQEKSQASQKLLQDASQSHQAELQRLSQDNQQRLQQMSYENERKIHDVERWSTRQLEAAQELWDLMEKIVSTYALETPEVDTEAPIAGVAPPTLNKSSEEIGLLIRKHGFFLPKRTAPLLVQIRDQLLRHEETLGTLHEKVKTMRETMKADFGVEF
jgi:hypothetical protein